MKIGTFIEMDPEFVVGQLRVDAGYNAKEGSPHREKWERVHNLAWELEKALIDLRYDPDA